MMRILRNAVLPFVLLVALCGLAQNPALPSVQLNADNGTGKQLEEPTRKGGKKHPSQPAVALGTLWAADPAA